MNDVIISSYTIKPLPFTHTLFQSGVKHISMRVLGFFSDKCLHLDVFDHQ